MIQSFVVYMAVISAAVFVLRYLKKLLTRGEDGHEKCADCALMDARLRQLSKTR